MQIDKINKKEIIKNIDEHISEISKEFKNGFEILEKHQKSVTIFGSTRLYKENKYYSEAENLSKRIVTDTGYTVITGGGPGIMEAANKGAKESGGKSIGFNIVLPREQHINSYVSESLGINYFFIRKALMGFSAECYVFFPGGFGTLDELFGIITLLQTKKIPKVPVVLFGSDFWNPIIELIEQQLLSKYGTIDKEDLELFLITDSIDKTIEIIKNAHVSEWWKMID